MSRNLKATERLFLIANYISHNPGVTARELAERYHVSMRSIYRDINRLDQIGVQVITRDGGGYVLIDQTAKLSAYLNTEEYLALAISPIIDVNDQVFQHAYHQALDKVLAHMRVNQNAVNQVKILSDKMRIHQGKKEKSDSEHLEKIIYALAKNESINCVYYSMYRDEISDRVIDPYYLIPKSGFLYLLGFCHKRKQMRTFRLNRFKKIELTNQTFEIDKLFDIDQYLANTWGIYREGYEVRFEVHFSQRVARYIKEQSYDITPTITDLPDGSLLFNVTVRGADGFLRWVKQFGKNAEILSPQEYRRQMLEEIIELQKMYSKSIERESAKI